MSDFIVTSPVYEILRYGPDKIRDKAESAHSQDKLLKFVIGTHDLKDPDKAPLPDNFKFDICQYEQADIVIFVKGRKSVTLKGA
mgnify:CR=1 FL=1